MSKLHPGRIYLLQNNLWQLMMGMLGLGGLRTFEKIQGVTK